MKYSDEMFGEIKDILVHERRWTPRAFEKFGVLTQGKKFFVPVWGQDVGVTYDFGNSDSSSRKSNAAKSRPKGKKAVLFGNLEFLESKVWLVEGEWDLFAAFEFGIESVVSSSNGAGSFSEDMARNLAGREVVIVYDNDEAGRVGAQKAAGLLKMRNCTVKILDLSEFVDEKGDLRDFFSLGYSKEELLTLAQNTEVFITAEERQVQENLANLKNLSQIPSSVVDWFWEKMIPYGSVTLLTGDPGSGKSTVVSFLAAVASKGGFLFDSSLGNYIQEQKVMIFSVEDPPEQVLKPRLSKFGAIDLNVFVYPDILILDDIGKATIRAAVAKHRPRFVIVDPIVSYLGGKVDTSKANEVREKMNFFAKLAEEFGLAILIVRHMAKASQGQTNLIYSGHGSIDFTASVRSELMLIRHPQKSDLRLFGQIKSNFGKVSEHYQIDMTDGSPAFDQDTSGETLEMAIARTIFDSQTHKKKEIYEATKNAIESTLGDRPMYSTDFEDVMKDGGYKGRTISRLFGEREFEFGKLRINWIGDGAGKGRWVAGRKEHLEFLRQQRFQSEQELTNCLLTQAFPNSKFQDCQ